MSSLATLIARGRAAAESLMTDTCTIARVTGRTLNQSTGVYTDTTSTIYSGKCRVHATDANAAELPTGGQEVVLNLVTVSVPTSATGIEVGDKVTVSASTHDDDLADRVFVVRAVTTRSHVTARRLMCEERQA